MVRGVQRCLQVAAKNHARPLALALVVACATACSATKDTRRLDDDDSGPTGSEADGAAATFGGCPDSEPDPGAACSGESECDYGTECCAGGCSPSTIGRCSDGFWVVTATDACLGGDDEQTDLCGQLESNLPSSCSSDSDCATYCRKPGGPTTCCDPRGLCLELCEGAAPLQPRDAAASDASTIADGEAGVADAASE
jgi:hypothetical protein